MALLRAAREEVLALAEARGCEVVGVFGSAARGTDDSSSDIDLLVRFPPGADIKELVRPGPEEDRVAYRLEDLSRFGAEAAFIVACGVAAYRTWIVPNVVEGLIPRKG